jgi:hypothetical protein
MFWEVVTVFASFLAMVMLPRSPLNTTPISGWAIYLRKHEGGLREKERRDEHLPVQPARD